MTRLRVPTLLWLGLALLVLPFLALALVSYYQAARIAPKLEQSRVLVAHTTEDMKGLRIRFASPTIRDFVAALGGSPVGVLPTEQVEQLQKGTIDGVFIDYGGAGIAFKMGGILKYSTEMYSYVSSFGVGMNPAFWDKLPPDLQALVTKSMTGVEKEVGEAWDDLDAPGKKALIDGGAAAIRLTPEERLTFRKIGAAVAEAKISELQGKGMPARAIYTRMKALAEEHAKTSRSFWT